MLSTDRVDLRNQLAEMTWLVPVARLDLVLLRIQVLLGTWPDSDVLTQLEAAVDPVVGGERGRQNQPDLERWPATVLQILVKDVGGIREEVRTQILADVRLRELGQVCAQLCRRIPPREIGL